MSRPKSIYFSLVSTFTSDRGRHAEARAGDPQRCGGGGAFSLHTGGVKV